MKSVCLSGSLRYYKEILNLESKLKKEGIPVERPMLAKKYRREEDPGTIHIPEGMTEEEILKDVKQIESQFLTKIDKQNILYIICPNGYIGKAAAAEIGYAKAKNKEIISSHSIEDFSIRVLVSAIISPGELIKYCKK